MVVQAPARILVVEDDNDIAQVLDDLLREEGYAVEREADGVAGLAHAVKSHPDLVLLDLMLPGLDGIEVCRQLREQEESPQVPVIIVSALTSAPDRVRGIRSGADDYVTKPFNAEELLSRVALRLARARREREQREAAVRAALQAIGYTVATPTSVAELVLHVVDLTGIAAAGAACGILLWNDEGRYFEPGGCSGLDGTRSALFAALRVSPARSSCVEDLVGQRRLFTLGPASADPLSRTLLDALMKEAIAAAPMQYDGRLYGMLTLARTVPRKEFSEAELRLVSRIADQAALALAKRHSLEHLERLATTDPLTGLANRRYFRDFLAQQLAQTARTGEVTSLLLIDLDHFKRVNDAHGHLAGDAVLSGVASALRHSIRDSDVAARYGGEEFAIILPGADRRQAGLVAERVLQGIRSLRIDGDGVELRVTASIGVATEEGHDVHGFRMSRPAGDAVANPGGEGGPPEDLIRAADRALYLAKRGGRDRVRTYGAASATVSG